MIYKFSKLELVKVLRTKYCNQNGVSILNQPTFKHEKVYYENSFDNQGIVNPYVVSAWHLTEIKDALTNRKITLTYAAADRDINAFSGTSISNFAASKNYCVLTHSKSITKTPVLSTIDYPDGHKVTFTYGTVNRIDLNGDRVLSAVDVTYNGRTVSKYMLTTSYFILNRIGTPTSDYQKKCARLCLTSVRKVGVDLKTEDYPYRFEYYTGSDGADDFIPPPFSHLKDIWGFFNGDNGRDYFGSNNISLTKDVTEMSFNQLRGLCFLRNSGPFPYNAKSGRAKNGLLKQVSMPTGGSVKYEYEQNMATLDGQYRNVGGVHVSKVISTDGGYSNGCNNPLVTNYVYSASEGSSESSLWGTQIPDNSIQMTSYFDPVDRYFYYKPIFNFGCDYRYKYPGIIAKDQGTSLTTAQQVLVVLSEVMNIVSGVMVVIDVVKLFLSATPAAWTAVIIDVVVSVINIVISCTSNQSELSTTTVYYNSDINGINPLPTQFGRVEIIEGSGTAGKTIMDFTTPTDHAIWVEENPSMSRKQRFASWAYGLTKKVTVKDATNNIIKETENVYDFDRAQRSLGSHGLPNNPSCKCLVKKSASQASFQWADPSVYDPPNNPDLLETNEYMIVDRYGFYTGRVELERTKERIYKQGTTQYTETVTRYEYSLDNFQLTAQYITESSGKENFKKYKYSVDYIGGGVLQTLIDNNILFAPVSVVSGIISGGTSYLLNETVTEYTTLPNGDIKELRKLEQRVQQPTSPWHWYGSFTINYIETESYTYDAAGSLIGVKEDGDRTVTNIYNYFDNKLLVASAINADPVSDKIAYTSFEKFGTDESKWISGGWTRSGGTGGFGNGFITGINSLALGTSTLTAATTSSKPYILSFWSTTATVTITGGTATLLKSGPAISTFTYYEYKIAPGATSISLSGTATIDELRLYPKNARMNTIAYDPVNGKISECDENNRTTYYEYDELGRLRFIKNYQKWVTKMYEYNVKSTGCATTYTHPAIIEIYRKSCGAGFIGSEVPYTIPAGKYTSTISQEMVNLMIENELNTLGQSNANTSPSGTCIQIFTNDPKSQPFTKQGCDVGYVGTSVTYSVPAGRYTSLINKQDANDQAQEDIDANGQAYANKQGVATCVASTVAEWIGTGEEQCQDGHKLKRVRDLNPNSSTYNQTQWIDVGVDLSCPQGCAFVNAPSSSISSSSITKNGNDVTFYLNVNAYGTNWSNQEVHVATISGACKPYEHGMPYTFVFTDNGTFPSRTWRVIIYPVTGEVKVIYQGSSPPPPSSSVMIHIPLTTFSTLP